jgi:intracellular multiplication protein IcmJ
MKLLPILLSVKRKAFRADSPNPSAADKVYIAARKKTLERDQYVCRFCGFRNAKNEVHHANDDHEDHSSSNLQTACVLCHMSFHVAFAGIQGRGKIICLPGVNISQADLNQIVRQLWIAESIGTGDLKNTATQLLARLEKCEIHAVSVLGTANAAMLGDHLASLSDVAYSKRGDALESVYLLPLKSAYSSYVKIWCEESRNNMPTDWSEAAKKFFSECGGIT